MSEVDELMEILLEPNEKSAETHEQQIKMVEHSGRYSLGPPKPPEIKFDNGFLDVQPKRKPTLQDRAMLVKWLTKLNGAEALCNNGLGKHLEDCSYGDLKDATRAYRHFLFGKGAPLTVDYERFVTTDDSGKQLMVRLREDFQYHIERIGRNRTKFSVTSELYAIGIARFAPYPATENWQKTLGAHVVWVSADVVVSVNGGKIMFNANLTIHAADKYNFNPNNKDVKTKIKDEENGAFELCGFGHQFLVNGIISRVWSWEKGSNPPKQ